NDGGVFASRLERRRCHDGGNGRVVFMSANDRTGRQRDGRDVDAVTDVDTGQIDRYLLGDVVGADDQAERVVHNVQRAAALEAGASFFIDELHMHLNGELGVLADAEEVHMQREILDRIKLVVAGNHAVLGAINIELDDVGLEAASIDVLVRILVGDGDGDGGFLVTVDNSRNESLTTQLTSGPLAHSFARLCTEHFSCGRSH